MKKNYTSNQKPLLVKWHKATKALGFVLLFMAFIQFGFAQTTINWTGDVSSDASDPLNWEPQQAPPGNTLVIDSAYKFTNQPIYNVNSSVNLYDIDPAYTSQFTINVVKDSVVDVNGSSSSHLNGHGNFTKGGEGLLTFRANVYLESINDTINVNNGTLEVRSALLMGKSNGTAGGYLNISDNGVVYSKGTYAPGRFADDSLQSVITITDNGRLEVTSKFPPDWSEDAEYYVARKQITSTPDREIIVEFDTKTNKTIVYSRDRMAFLVEPAETQNIEAKENGKILRILENDGLASMNSLVWKYSSTSGSGYTDFSTSQTGDTLIASFDEAGEYYVVCIGDNGTSTDTTNEVKFIVSSDKIHVHPDGEQTIKLGQTPYTLSVIEDEESTSREWLISTTLGSGFQAFDPAVTDTFITPQFDEVGTYYVMCKSVIGGVEHETKQVKINVTPTSEWSDIRWTGEYGNEAGDVRNWNPHASLHQNTLTIDIAEYVNEPILTTSGNDTIGNLGINPGATFTLNKPSGDTLYRGSDHYLNGKLIVQSGTYYLKGRLRLESDDAIVDISGGSIAMATDFIVGSNNGPIGGMIDIHGTGVIDAGAQVWRFATDTTRSVITIWDEGKLIIHGDHLANVETWIAKKQLQSQIGWEIIRSYNADDDVTTVTAFDPNAINITPLADQILALNEAASALSASNTSIYDSLIWKYSTSMGGDLIAFEPYLNDVSATPSFDKAGTYYVVCVGINDTLTKVSNSVKIIVPDVSITPDTKQVMRLGVPSVEFEVTESPDPIRRVWQYAATSGGTYSSTTPEINSTTYAANFPTTGSYYIVCNSEYESKHIISNEVELEVVDIELSPSGNQTINTNTDGATISVSETGAVDSREWLYTTTSGQDYTSFTATETGTDYTPNFASAGTYYVVCATVFSGTTIYSDEVTITVNSNTGVNNTELNSLVVYPNPTTGKFRIQEELNGKYRIDVYNNLGKLVLSEEFNGLEGTQEFSLDTKGIYVINLVTPTNTKTTKLIVE